MTIEETKNIKLADYLHSLGYNPVKQQGSSLWYKSPFREEKEPSFKVNPDRNLWYDFGLGKGGNIIALAQELYASDSVPYLLDKIAQQALHVRPVSFSFRQQSSTQPSFQQLEVVPLSSPALYSYLQERGINTELAKRECKEVRFVNNGKQFFAVGFKNNSGGYEIRNRFFKGCVSPKDITLIGRNSNVCHLYEGFMDFLSAVILGIGRGEDHIVLNSVANMQKVHHLLDGYAQVYCHLDNDEAGENACVELQKRYGDKVIDHSHLYTGYKDLNEYLMSHKTRK